MPSLTLEQLIQYVDEIPPLPSVAVRVIQLTDDPSASARAIGDTISADITMTTRLLRIANSAYYGMSRRISTVNEAVVLLGMQSVRGLAVAAAAYDTLNREAPGYSLPAGELWRHSISCAITSQIVAKRSRVVRAEEAFVAGLLHDVGKVILNAFVGAQFESILALVDLEEIPFFQAEKTVLGFDHAEVGAKIAEKWNLPPVLCTAIAGHHDLSKCQEAPQLASVVHLANGLCLMEGIGIGGDGLRTPLLPEAMEVLRVTEDDLLAVLSEMVEHVEQARGMFELAKVA